MSTQALLYGGIPAIIITMLVTGFSLTIGTINKNTGKYEPASDTNRITGYSIILLTLFFTVVGIYSLFRKNKVE